MDDLKLLYQTMNSNKDYFECQRPVIIETEKAICFDRDNSHLSSQQKGVWIPKSQMVIIPFTGNCDTRYFIKNWLYSKLK